MPDVVEIYICKPGQELTQGQLVVSNDIETREYAREDAESRCAEDRSIERIAYYAIADNGDFRSYFSYKNADVFVPPPNGDGGGAQKKSKKKNSPAKMKLGARIKDFFSE